MCGNCLSKVKPKLDAETQIEEWSVDTSSKDKMLNVNVSADASAEVVVRAVRAAGFSATEIRPQA